VSVVDDESVRPRSTRRSITTDIPPEERLVLLTASVAARDDAIRAMAATVVDWTRFLALAEVERSVSVTYASMQRVAADLVPQDVLDRMRRLALVTDYAMLHLDSRLRESLSALQRAGVRVMLLKGAALAYSVYGDVRKRPMSDIDLLVDQGSAENARRAMLSIGWRELSGGVADAAYERHHHSPPLADTQSPQLHLEIHSALFPARQPFAFDVRDLWSRARRLDGANPEAFVPDPVHSLLHACLHFLWSHLGRFGAWRTIRDVEAISRCPDMDWDAFVSIARQARGGTSCYWTLRIARTVAGVEVPAGVVDELRPRRSTSVLRAIERHFLMNLVSARRACPSVALDRAIWELGVMPRRSSHGDIRPWDGDHEFMLPRGAESAAPMSSRAARVRRLLASPRYIGSLLRARDLATQ